MEKPNHLSKKGFPKNSQIYYMLSMFKKNMLTCKLKSACQSRACTAGKYNIGNILHQLAKIYLYKIM